MRKTIALALVAAVLSVAPTAHANPFILIELLKKAAIEATKQVAKKAATEGYNQLEPEMADTQHELREISTQRQEARERAEADAQDVMDRVRENSSRDPITREAVNSCKKD